MQRSLSLPSSPKKLEREKFFAVQVEKKIAVQRKSKEECISTGSCSNYSPYDQTPPLVLCYKTEVWFAKSDKDPNPKQKKVFDGQLDG
jgi:hypothetical protein